MCKSFLQCSKNPVADWPRLGSTDTPSTRVDSSFTNRMKKKETIELYTHSTEAFQSNVLETLQEQLDK